MKHSRALNQKFDYEIGYLVQSPCRNCSTYATFPDCIDRCTVLDRVQNALSDSLSSVNNYSAAESYYMPVDMLEGV